MTENKNVCTVREFATQQELEAMFDPQDSFCAEWGGAGWYYMMEDYTWSGPFSTKKEAEKAQHEYFYGSTQMEANVASLKEEGMTHDEACHELDCCKGCYRPGEYLYCSACYDKILGDMQL